MENFMREMQATFMSEGAGAEGGLQSLIRMGIVGAIGVALFTVGYFAINGINNVKTGISEGSAVLDGETVDSNAAGWFAE